MVKSRSYEEFVGKFKPKKTTDDCYTPPEVYDAVLAWVRREYGIPDDAPIVQPFWPGGDYEREEYPEGCVVVDNPPFSIFARIVCFYMARGVRFFLFAPVPDPVQRCCRARRRSPPDWTSRMGTGRWCARGSARTWSRALRRAPRRI